MPGGEYKCSIKLIFRYNNDLVYFVCLCMCFGKLIYTSVHSADVCQFNKYGVLVLRYTIHYGFHSIQPVNHLNDCYYSSVFLRESVYIHTIMLKDCVMLLLPFAWFLSDLVAHKQ